MRVGFFGQTGPFAPPAFLYLVEHAVDFDIVLTVEGIKRAPTGRRHVLEPPRPRPLPTQGRLAALSTAVGVPALVTADVNARRAIAVVAEHDLDWIVCVGFDRLFGQAVLDCGQAGGINVHPSMLPDLRGPSPIFWAFRDARPQLGVTLHRLDAREDHGAILSQRPFDIVSRATGAEIFATAAELAAPMLLEQLQHAARGTLSGQMQDHALATRAPRPTADDARVDPSDWRCEHLVDFACGAAFFRAAWLRMGDDTFFARRGLRAELGRRLPAQYVQQGSTLVVQCSDGVAHLEIQV